LILVLLSDGGDADTVGGDYECGGDVCFVVTVVVAAVVGMWYASRMMEA
jgi:hypothetical protein